MMPKGAAVVCYGELLWDELPQGRIIGGAPFNVAQRLHSLGVAVTMISSVGGDDLGRQALEIVREQDMPIKHIQTHKHWATGTVQVALNEAGSASYTILEPVAWDGIELTPALMQQTKDCELFIFGSLAARHQKSRSTLEELVALARDSVFDVNLRPPHYDLSWIMKMIAMVSVVKFNDEELALIFEARHGQKGSIHQQLDWLLHLDPDKIWCVTLGAHGAQLYVNGAWYKHSGYQVEVADTVGAGDTFLATLIKGLLLNKRPPEDALDQAVAYGAVVASKTGANARVTAQDITYLTLCG